MFNKGRMCKYIIYYIAYLKIVFLLLWTNQINICGANNKP